jgi:hypothetical protein
MDDFMDMGSFDFAPTQNEDLLEDALTESLLEDQFTETPVEDQLTETLVEDHLTETASVPENDAKSEVNETIANFNELSLTLPACTLLQDKFPELKEKVKTLRQEVRILVNFKRKVTDCGDFSTVPARLRTLHQELGEEFESLVEEIHSRGISGRKLDMFLFRQRDKRETYKIVRITKNKARLARIDEETNVEVFDIRSSLENLIEQLSRGQLDVFGRGQLFKFKSYIFCIAQLNLFDWIRRNAVLEYMRTIMVANERAGSRKRSSATVNNGDNINVRKTKR